MDIIKNQIQNIMFINSGYNLLALDQAFKWLQQLNLQLTGFYPSNFVYSCPPPQRFSFFIISLVHCFHEVPPWWALKEYFSNLGLQIVGKSISGIHSDFFATSFWLFLIFLGNFEFYRELARRIHKILQVSKPKKEWG